MVEINLAESFDELPDLEPPPRRATIQEVALKQAYVVLHRVDEYRLLPQLPLINVQQQPDPPLEVDWIQVEYELAALDHQPLPQQVPPQLLPPQFQPQPLQPPIDWELIAVALINLARIERTAAVKQ